MKLPMCMSCGHVFDEDESPADDPCCGLMDTRDVPVHCLFPDTDRDDLREPAR